MHIGFFACFHAISLERSVSVCLSVCVSTTILALQATRRLVSDTNSFSATENNIQKIIMKGTKVKFKNYFLLLYYTYQYRYRYKKEKEIKGTKDYSRDSILITSSNGENKQ